MVLLAIHVAARDGDLVAMRRELAQGVSPNAPTRHHGLMNPSLYPILLRAGAALNPIPTHPDPYLAKILAAGGFRGNGFQNYERARRNAMNAMFIPKFALLLPPELQSLGAEAPLASKFSTRAPRRLITSASICLIRFVLHIIHFQSLFTQISI